MQSYKREFYKYYSSSTALLVLQSGKTRWSAPRLFNDPFDFPNQMHYSFSGETAANALIDELIDLSYGSAPIVGNSENRYLNMAQLMRMLPNKPTPNDFRKTLYTTIEEVSRKFEEHKLEGTEKLNFLRNECAVFCVTEVKDNLLMWSHYAESHTGCVLKFKDMPGTGQRLQFSERVNYLNHYPSMMDIVDYVKLLTGQTGFDPHIVRDRFVLSKSKHWKYENELRTTFRLADIENGYDYCDLLDDELEEVYIGCKAVDGYIQEVVRLVDGIYPKAAIFRARNRAQDYSIQFERIR